MDFGLFKILVVVSTFAMLVNEAGIPDALIQRRDSLPRITRPHGGSASALRVADLRLTVEHPPLRI